MNLSDDAANMAAMGVSSPSQYTGLQVVIADITDTNYVVAVRKVTPTPAPEPTRPLQSPPGAAGWLLQRPTGVVYGCLYAAANQGTAWQQAASDLVSGETTDGGDTSGYAAAAAELNDLASLPDTSETPAQMAQFQSDVQALDTFFATPGLYITSPTTC